MQRTLTIGAWALGVSGLLALDAHVHGAVTGIAGALWDLACEDPERTAVFLLKLLFGYCGVTFLVMPILIMPRDARESYPWGSAAFMAVTGAASLAALALVWNL